MSESRFKWSTPAEAKAVIKELKLKRRELVAAKSAFSKQIAEIRAAYRSRVAQRGTKLRGMGGFGKFVRGIQTVGRDADRADTDKAIRPLEARIAAIDSDIRGLDAAVLQVEQWIVQNPAEAPPKRTVAPKAGKEPDVVDQLERLGKLRDAGVLTAEEFEAKKRELLDRP